MNFAQVSKKDLDEEILKFLLLLYSHKLFSKKSVNEILTKMDQFICKKYIPYIQTQVQDQLDTTIPADKINQIQFIIENTKHPFGAFLTEYRRFAIFTERGFITPNRFLLGTSTVFNTETKQKFTPASYPRSSL